MSCSIHLSFPAHALKSRRNSKRKRVRLLHTHCSPLQSNLHESEENADKTSCECKPQVVLVERFSNGTSKRYVVEDDLRLKTSLQEKISENSSYGESHLSDTNLSWLPDAVRNFILPAGFPGSVSDDYLQYMLLQFPTNVTAWICHTLVTSSLLKGVGVGSFSSTSAAASAAAIRWVSKDGIGALGRLFIGGRFGDLFDDDPKQWRMYADFIGSAGSIFDLATQVYPAYFLPLASVGNLTKKLEVAYPVKVERVLLIPLRLASVQAVARGLKDPSFRVIQNHFAISGNLGEVAAKEEVWEVTAQLLGLGLGILVLDTPGIVKSFPMLALTWISMRLLHLWLRYQSLLVLQFDTINLKRARILVKSHILHSRVLESVDCNREENILLLQTFMRPRILFGVSVEEMISGESPVAKLKSLLRLYAKERYVLVVKDRKPEFEVLLSFKAGATSMSVLRSLWQAYWIHENWDRYDNAFNCLEQSLLEMESRFQDFIQQLNLSGWDMQQLNLKVPKGIYIDELSTF